MKTVKKPWGEEVHFFFNKKGTLKILEVSPGEMFSYQNHQKRSEFWYVIEGNPTVILNDKTTKHKPGDTIKVGKRVKHRISNKTNKKVRVLEFSSGAFDQNDIIRYKDKYNRIKG